MYQGKFQDTHKATRPKKKRLWLRILLSVVAVVLVLTGGLYIYANTLLDNLDRSAIEGDATLSLLEAIGGDAVQTDHADSTEQMAAMQGAYDADGQLLSDQESETILLVGSDTRGEGDAGRSDSMMLVTINYETNKIHLTSLMRTLYVCIPMEEGNTWFALNAAYAWGGIDLLQKTIEQNFKVEIDNYAVVDFDAFEKTIDILGGIDLELTRGEANYINKESGSVLGEGMNHLTGEQALWYARCRELDNDFVRTSRQRTVVETLFHQATQCGVKELQELATQILPLINTDLSNSEIISHAIQLASMGDFEVDQLMLPIENMNGETFEGIMYVEGLEVYGYDVRENLNTLHEFLES